MALPLSGKTNVTAPNAAYPYGDIKDNTGSNNGTPVNKSVYADIHQFFARIFALSGLTYNNLLDNATNGFQYVDALVKYIKIIIDGRPKHVISAYSTGQFTTTSGVNVILINNKSIDTESEFSITTGRFTPTEPGYYELTCNSQFNLPTGTAAAVSIGLDVRKNGSKINDNAITYITNNVFFYSVSSTIIVSLNGTSDYIDFAHNQSITATCNVGMSVNICMIARS